MAEKDFARLEQFIHRIALSIAQDFGEVRKSLATLSDDVGTLEKRMDTRFDVVEGKLDAFDRRLDREIEARHKLDDRISRVETKLEA